jgi:hypothetical protein
MLYEEGQRETEREKRKGNESFLLVMLESRNYSRGAMTPRRVIHCSLLPFIVLFPFITGSRQIETNEDDDEDDASTVYTMTLIICFAIHMCFI